MASSMAWGPSHAVFWTDLDGHQRHAFATTDPCIPGTPLRLWQAWPQVRAGQAYPRLRSPISVRCGGCKGISPKLRSRVVRKVHNIQECSRLRPDEFSAGPFFALAALALMLIPVGYIQLCGTLLKTLLTRRA